jgi:hypothetical protein
VDYNRVSVEEPETNEVFRIAVVSKGDQGNGAFFVDESGCIDIQHYNHKTCSICLTKHNYIPFWIETGRFDCTNENVSLYLQNQCFNGNVLHYGTWGDIQDIYVGNQVDNENEEGDIVIDSGAKVDLFATKRVTIQSGFQCKMGGKLLINSSQEI